MSLARSIRKATKTSLKAMNSVGESVVYHQVTGSSYDTDLGSVRRTTLSFPIRAWFTSFKEKEVDGNNVRPEDKRCTFEVMSLAIVPSLKDFVIDEAGEEWEVMNKKLPPPKILYILHVRRP